MTSRDEQIAERRSQISPKYQGVYDKAVGGRSPKSGIHITCLFCTGFVIKAITNCSDAGCQWFLYRPYQEIPHKFLTRQNKGNLNRTPAGQIGQGDKKSPRTRIYTHSIKNAPQGNLKVIVAIEPEG